LTRFPVAPPLAPLGVVPDPLGLRSVAIAEAEAAAAALKKEEAAAAPAAAAPAAEPAPAPAVSASSASVEAPAEPQRARRLSPTRAAAIRNLSPLGLRAIGGRPAVSPSRANITLKRYKK
jgi:pyruvate/2-oxoglutarate dehydrogenase complex dihydrolipoamide acyltransferase (E2) component